MTPELKMTPELNITSENDTEGQAPLRTAFFAGSFNPFTIGHADIVSRGLNLFDRIIIGVGINPAKTTAAQVRDRVKSIEAVYSDEPRVTVISYDTLTADAARRSGATVLLRSVRDVADYEYERNLADINRRISGLDTVFLTARPELACVSSSLVRELRHFGHNADEFLPSSTTEQ